MGIRYLTNLTRFFEFISITFSTPLCDHTIIFFDWDDTLMASNVLCAHQVTLQTPVVPREIDIMFQTLQDQVINILDTAFKATKHVFVITNAEQGWVELSCQKFMPKVFQHIQDVKIISARTTYQNSFPDKPNMWKKTAFIERINTCFPSHAPKMTSAGTVSSPIGPPNLNAISFGDSECERNALISITQLCASTATLKSIKFVERPSTEQLKRQLEMIQHNFHFIVRHNASLDLMLQICTVQATPNDQRTTERPTPASQNSDQSEGNGLERNTTEVGADVPYNSPDGRLNGPPGGAGYDPNKGK
ncbi:putative protein kinase [Blattamonas nauphoetae]|uniref:Uncharacterized protein n=1 Tax=Blattamonas nauphoetae TaxID=2049346 RepID=A0ABQ9Y9H7_9EUKA|nr:putative protein kinase [Blattamonas nauphoetae]